MDTSLLLTHHWSKDAMLQLPQVGVKAYKFDSPWENISLIGRNENMMNVSLA